nr:MAG TPA: ATP dependent helicase [Caudoviricetes sp.]
MIDIFEQLTVFDDYLFDEEPHIYYYKGEKVGVSGTKLLEKYENTFDSEKMAPFSAKKLNMSVDEVLNMWKTENLISQIKGTHLHAYMENMTANKLYNYPKEEIKNTFGHDTLLESWFIITSMMDDFKNDMRGKLIPIKSELIIGCPEFDIAGAIDQLYFNKETNELEIWDWKTNKEIKFEGYKGQTLLGKYNYLQDCNFIHYSIQLNIYKYILQRMTNLKIGACRIVWFNEKNKTYQVIDCKDLYKEAEELLLERKEELESGTINV